jgi:Outer membrane protein beta-barrel domain
VKWKIRCIETRFPIVINHIIEIPVMKKIILVAVVMCFTVFGNAQVRFGVKAGYNLSSLIYSGTLTLEGEKSKSGFYAGIFASVPFSKSFSLVPELFYSSQGANYQNSYGNGNLSYDYFNIPVLLRFKMKMGIYFETGIQTGILLSANEKNNGTTTEIMYKTYSTDFAWPVGLGYQIPGRHFGIDLRYNLGLINVLKSGSDANVKNSVFQFGIFYLF